jgi:hypothetical protein
VYPPLPTLLLLGRCLFVDSAGYLDESPARTNVLSDSLVTSALHGALRVAGARDAGEGGQVSSPSGDLDAAARDLKAIIASKFHGVDGAPLLERLPNGNTKLTYSLRSVSGVQFWEFEVIRATDTVIPRNVAAADILQDFGAASFAKSLPGTSSRPIKIIGEPSVVEVRMTLAGAVTRTGGFAARMFEDGRPYALQLNMSLPGAASLRESLLSVLGKSEYQGALVFNPFTPQGNVPTPVPVEIKIGRRVPLGLAQAILTELSKIPSLSFAISVFESDNDFLQYNRIYVGAMVKSNKSAVTAADLRRLLEAGLGQSEFLNRLRAFR